MSPSSLPWFFTVVLWLFGVGFVYGGIRNVRESREFLSSAQTVPGVVVGVHVDGHGDLQRRYAKLRFTTHEGQPVETTSYTSHGPLELFRMQNQTVPVLYDPRNPRRARINSGSGRGVGGSTALAAVGVVMFLIGTAIAVAHIL
ncbi:DUF3592 domain-containing protein [Actinomadura logoneensis]|uniref:DUF3592 domain-containing protein n=1 Tax=Actinomadura logoneensis TaxID=2293572 RepID=A0A372JPN1_9ACTN|nr:DUF3592 domain-containing protein [Actinomadura logoneensis]RFU41919.1 DUF3592 domain-containing protein [Actinomadura logoneensis]